MTNIGALKVVETDKDKPTNEYIVCVADGMGSAKIPNTDRYQKEDNFQKLYNIQNFLVMGTGFSNIIEDIAGMMSERRIRSAGELAHNIKKELTLIKLGEKDGTNFIVAGFDENKLNIHQIIKQGNYDAMINPNRPFCFDGSGSEYVNKYINSLQKIRKPIFSDDVTEALAVMYDFGIKGAEDGGVNDKLQFGIIKNGEEKGISTIYHPDIRLKDYQFDPYISNMVGLNIVPPQYNGNKNDDESTIKKKEKQYEKDGKKYSNQRDSANKIMREIYSNLMFDLKDYQEAKEYFTYIAEHFGAGKVDYKTLKKVRDSRAEHKNNVSKGVQAIINKGIDNLLDYQEDFEKRQTKHEHTIKKYFK